MNAQPMSGRVHNAGNGNGGGWSMTSQSTSARARTQRSKARHACAAGALIEYIRALASMRADYA